MMTVFLISSLSLSLIELVPLSLSPHSFSHLTSLFLIQGLHQIGLGTWFDLGMVVGWDRLMVGLDPRGSVG